MLNTFILILLAVVILWFFWGLGKFLGKGAKFVQELLEPIAFTAGVILVFYLVTDEYAWPWCISTLETFINQTKAFVDAWPLKKDETTTFFVVFSGLYYAVFFGFRDTCRLNFKTLRISHLCIVGLVVLNLVLYLLLSFAAFLYVPDSLLCYIGWKYCVFSYIIFILELMGLWLYMKLYKHDRRCAKARRRIERKLEQSDCDYHFFM